MADSPELLPAIRAHFGWSQQTLAEALGVTRSRLAHAEASTRLLPLGALPRLALLVNCLPVAADFQTPQTPTEPAALRQRQRQCLHLAEGIERQMAALETRAAQATARLAALPLLLAAPPVAALAPVAGPAWYRVQALEAETILTEAGPTAHALLRARQAGLLAEAAALAALLNE